MAFYPGICGARWNRTTDFSIIRAGQSAGQAIGIRSELPVRATTSQFKTGRAISFGHALGTQREAKPRGASGPAIIEPSGEGASLP